jgi:hypothetical protein
MTKRREGVNPIQFRGPRGMTPEERFWPKVAQREADECWLWLGYVDLYGYGRFWLDGTMVGAHRFAYSLNRSLTPDMVIDHLCMVRHCVNPHHLREVTNADNIRSGYGTNIAAGIAMTRPTCSRGHAWTEENTWWSPGPRRYRKCRSCNREDQQRRRARKNATRVVVS